MMSKEFVITECIKILIILVIYTLICTVRFRREFDEADETHRMNMTAYLKHFAENIMTRKVKKI